MNQKLLIFDLDGVLIDSKEIHYNALNVALEQVFHDNRYFINQEDHLSIYDGLPTKRKLQILTKKKGLPTEFYDEICGKKQKETLHQLRWITNPVATQTVIDLKKLGYKIAVASNSIRDSVKMSLIALDIIQYVDYYISNEDVAKAKPSPHMYWKCMEMLDAIPSTTWIIEDSPIGRQGAINSGAHLIPVDNPSDVTTEYILSMIENRKKPMPWIDNNLNVLIPMAGLGSRFSQAGYTFPKPLIEIEGKPMIQVVVENLNIKAHYIFLVQKEHYEKYQLQYMLNLIAPGCDIIQVDGITEGAACTALLAKELINNDKHLLIANSDQFIEWNSAETMYSLSSNKNIDGGLLTFESIHPRWSFAKIGPDGYVTEVAEKKPISEHATCGIYWYSKGSDFVNYAESMIKQNIRTNNEFYIAPVYNEAIKNNKKIVIKPVKALYGTGTPEDLISFVTNHKDLL